MQSSSSAPSRGSIYLLEESGEAFDSIAGDLPDTELKLAKSSDELKTELYTKGPDIVVLDAEWSIDQYRNLLYELKTSDSQPALIVVSQHADPRTVTELYKHGCQRFIMKDERWLSELSLALRHTLRYRQVLNENMLIRTKLTEANYLLEERNKRLDEFSATVAHDIRGPLGSISMKLEYLLDHYNQGLDERCNELLNRSLNATRRLTDIVQAMYDFAKLGAKATKMGQISTNELVSEVVGDLNFDEKLDIEISIGDLPSVWGNAALLRRVFLNLINNAVKYSDKQQIKISINSEDSYSRGLGDFGVITVADNGAGIAPEDLKDVFSMFQRGSGVKDDSGSGVGLAVVQRIIELHFGHVKVESQLGRGTKFTLELPLQDLGLKP